MKKETAPGVTAPGHSTSAPARVSHWFSLARSPPGGAARLAFSLGRLFLNGGVCPAGGYEPITPGGARAFGENGGPMLTASRMAVSFPRLHPPPERTGQGPVLLFWGVPTTGITAASPNGPLHEPLGPA